MNPVKDIILIDDDLLIKNGDLVIGESDDQHIGLLMRMNKGDLKQYPLVGVGIDRAIKTRSGNFQSILSDARLQLVADGYFINHLTEVEGKINIDTTRIK
jgi:hypothetical protein